MARTALATRVYDTHQKGPRIPAGQVGYIVVHHTGGSGFEATIALELGAKQVSSTVIIDGANIASMFEEDFRAWSLSSQYWDSVSLSSETCNSGGAAEGWPISESSYQSLARVIADWCRRYGIPCDRSRIMGHREVYTRFGASYATACPGGIDLDRVVAMAKAILNPAATSTGEDHMQYITAAAAGGKPTRYALTDPVVWPDGALVTENIEEAKDFSRTVGRGPVTVSQADFDLWVGAAKRLAARVVRPGNITPAQAKAIADSIVTALGPTLASDGDLDALGKKIIAAIPTKLVVS